MSVGRIGFLAVANAVEEGWDEDPAYDRFGLGRYIGGKVVVDGKLFGTLCFASNEPRGEAFTDSERTFVKVASRWLGYEVQQRVQRNRQERQNDRLDRFASRASHDLRNPLSVAKGRLELAHERHGDDEDILAALDALADSDARIDEILEFARLGQTVTDPPSVSLPDVARAAWNRVGEGAATMTVEDDSEIWGDHDRIEALSNEFGFYVADDGPGIPAEDRETVLESGYTTSEDGSGFGLAIVTEIAAAHEWDVGLSESTEGGVRFEFLDV